MAIGFGIFRLFGACILGIILLIVSPFVHASVIKLEWSDLSNQFFVQPPAADKTGEHPAQRIISRKGYRLLKFTDTDVIAKHELDSCDPPDESKSDLFQRWKLVLLDDIDDLSPKAKERYRLLVKAVDEKSQFRVGLVSKASVNPGSTFFREWMVDSRGCWAVAGVPNAVVDLEGDSLWGAAGCDGWNPSKSIGMNVFFDREMVSFFDGSKGDPKNADNSRTELRFSLNGFSSLLSSEGEQHAITEKRTHTIIKPRLTLNDVVFNYTVGFNTSLLMGKLFKGELVAANPISGCSTPIEEHQKPAKGSVMFALRGECGFLDKVLAAQAAGAAALIVADKMGTTKDSAKRKQGSLSDESTLVTMSQVGRDSEATTLRIPSVFVSANAYRLAESLWKKRKNVSVVLQGHLNAPAHHGKHWKETGLTPAVWIAPGSTLNITLKPVGAILDSDSTSTGNQVCRPVSYTPLAISEARRIGDASNQASPHASKKPSPDSKRLAAILEVCNENSKTKSQIGNTAQQNFVPSEVIPWVS